MRPDVPIFDLTDTFDASVRIGDKDLPIKVKRFTRSEMEAFEKKWNAYFSEARGSAPRTPEQEAEREAQLLAFATESIRDWITLEPGYLRDRGKEVTTGEGLLDAFHGLFDTHKNFFSELLVAVFTKNKLSGVSIKNLKSLRDSGTGSAPTGESRSGDSQGPAASAAGRSGSALNGAATVSQGASEADVAGASAEATKVH